MRLPRFCAIILCFAGVASAQPAEFDASDFGNILIAPRQSSDGMTFEQAFGDYQNEPVIDYGIDGPAVQLGRPIGRLDLLRVNGTAGRCTAFIVDTDHIVTNHHCVPGMDGDPTGAVSGMTAMQFVAGYITPGRARDVDRYDVSLNIVETNRDLDYTVLQVLGDPSEKYGMMQLAAEDPEDSEFLWIIGHPEGQSQHISREGCAAASPALAEGKLVHTCDTLGGNSGSPVIRLSDHRVVALHHAGDNRTGYNHAIPMRAILAQSRVLKAAFAPNPTLSVKADGTGDHADLASAIAAADPGMRIEIHPGTYTGHVTVDKPLEIIGIGDRDDIILRAEEETVILWTAPKGRIANLTIRQDRQDEPRDDKGYGILFQGGTAVLEDSHLTSMGYAVVAVTGDANPVIRRNVIADGAYNGILMAGSAGQISQNVIERNKEAGIFVLRGTDVVINDNNIRNNGGSGVILTSGTTGVVENNKIKGQDGSGVWISGGASPKVQGNVIEFNGNGGVNILDEGTAQLEGNTIDSNDYGGLIVSTLASPIVRKNKIFGHFEAAISVRSGAGGTFEMNDLRNNNFGHTGSSDGAFSISKSAGDIIRKDNLE